MACYNVPMRIDPRLSVSLSGLDGATNARDALVGLSSRGVRCVQLDTTAKGMRGRELDRSARRDLGGVLRRHGLSLSGLDLWIPKEHFVEGAHIDRAVAGVNDAIDLAADLASIVGGGDPAQVSLTLPEGVSDEVMNAISQRAVERGVTLADHCWPRRDDGRVSIGLDPASVLGAGDDPVEAAGRLGSRVASARLSDLSADGRVAPGKGRLDVEAYIASLLALGYPGWMVLDLRSVRDQERTLADAIGRWSRDPND